MKDRRAKTFKILMEARDRKIKALETQLSNEQHAYTELQKITEAKKAEQNRQIQEQSERNARMQAMMESGKTIRVSDLYDHLQYQGIVNEQLARCEMECAQAESAEQTKQNEIVDIKKSISKNKAQKDEYKKLFEAIKSKALQKSDDALDEAAEEAIIAQRRFRH